MIFSDIIGMFFLIIAMTMPIWVIYLIYLDHRDRKERNHTDVK
jgi:hypothetical protein